MSASEFFACIEFLACLSSSRALWWWQGQKGLKSLIRESLKVYGYDEDARHIAVGRDCRTELKLLKTLAGLKQEHSHASDSTKTCCTSTRTAKEKNIKAACDLLAHELMTPSEATGQVSTYSTGTEVERGRAMFCAVGAVCSSVQCAA
jgi:hypothetical protein